MTALAISLPEDLKEFAEEQASQAGFASVSAYIQALLEEERRWSEEQLEAALLKSVENGKRIEVNDAFWKEFRARYRERLKRRAVS